jgi:hypothetical protein
MAAHFAQDLKPGFEFDPVALAVVEGNGFDPLIGLEGMGQTGGGVLSARK